MAQGDDKDCMNCELALITRDQKAICQHPVVTTRWPVGVYASLSRANAELCGPEARWFKLSPRPFKLTRESNK
jgi:hypothetical protein